MCSFAQSCTTPCNPLDCSPPGSSIHGILQARLLEWVAMPSSRGSSQARDRTRVSCIAGGFFTRWAIRDAPRKTLPPWNQSLWTYKTIYLLSCKFSAVFIWLSIAVSTKVPDCEQQKPTLTISAKKGVFRKELGELWGSPKRLAEQTWRLCSHEQWLTGTETTRWGRPWCHHWVQTLSLVPWGPRAGLWVLFLRTTSPHTSGN